MGVIYVDEIYISKSIESLKFLLQVIVLINFENFIALL